MFYPVSLSKGNTYTVRDLGMTTEANSMEDAVSQFSELLADYVEDNFRKEGKPIPTPSPLLPNDGVLVCGLKLEARILLWNLLKEKYMSTSEFARKIGVSRQAAQFMVDGTRPVGMDAYYRAFEALGYYLSLELNPFK